MQMDTNERTESTFKLPRTKSSIKINKQYNALGSTKSLQRSYNIESMNSYTDHIVTNLNVEEIKSN